MIDFPSKYHASFFGDFADVVPSAETIPPLLQALESRQLLPSTFHEIVATGPRVRLRFASSDNEWMIDFETRRITIDKNPTRPGGSNLGSVSAFAKESEDILARLLELHPKKGTRLSIMTTGLLPEMPASQLDALYVKMLVPTPFYTENPPVEWHARSTSRMSLVIEGEEELLNIITKISRIHVQIPEDGQIKSVDRIEFATDINTYQGNAEPRFLHSSVRAFFKEANEIRERIFREIEETLND